VKGETRVLQQLERHLTSRSPFGGVKGSGYGREGGRQGIEEYLTVKSMIINVTN